MIKCRKISYATKRAAKFRVKSIKTRGSKGKIRIYLCAYCECYHLTSYNAKSITKMKDRLMSEGDDNESSIGNTE